LRIEPVCDLREARLPDNQFDACVLIEVAEHLPYPRSTLTEAFHLLKPGGMLYVTTPNFASFRSLLRREDWAAMIPTGHLYYFTVDSLCKLLTAVGFCRVINLTPPAQFDSEVETARADGSLRVTPAQLESIRRQVAAEDAAKLFNGRGEGLVMCAIKPRFDHDAIVASLRLSKPMPELENKLVCAPGSSAEDGKVYFVREGRKHWVTSVNWLHQHGMRLEQTIQVDREVIDSILQGPPLME